MYSEWGGGGSYRKRYRVTLHGVYVCETLCVWLPSRSSGDRMGRLVGHVLRQQRSVLACLSSCHSDRFISVTMSVCSLFLCTRTVFSQEYYALVNIDSPTSLPPLLLSYYPLVPPYRREEVKLEPGAGGGDVPRPPTSEGGCDINMDYVQAFEEGRASLPVRPDLLVLPSDLKPFVKVYQFL